MKSLLSLGIISLLLSVQLSAEVAGKHLFILSGQSNMVWLKPKVAFTPAVEKEFGSDKVIVVHDAQSGKPLHRWSKSWKTPEGVKPEESGDLYDRLMAKVKKATEGQKLASVTFIWMQGERDARLQWSSLYEAGFKSLLQQLETDLGRKDLNVVIGRLSDFDNDNRSYKDWSKMRAILQKIAEEHPRGDWVNTDDLNDGINRKGEKISNDLHYSVEGYKLLGERFASKAIALVRRAET